MPEITDIAALGALAGLGVGLMTTVLIGLYVYYALALSTIAKKLGYKKPWLAWIPVANVFLLPILAKKNWAMGFLLFIPIVNIVFMIMWTWNIYEQRKYPGWLALIPIAGMIPLIGMLASIANLVVLGLVAWVDRK